MASKYSVLYAVYLNDGSTVGKLVSELGKKPPSYQTVYNFLKELQKEEFIEFKGKKCFLSEYDKTTRLLKLIDFCITNKIDYNELFLPKTIDFIQKGLKEGKLEDLALDNKTISRISLLLSRHGFLVIESRKPFATWLVYSHFLEKLVEFFKGKPSISCKLLHQIPDGEKLNNQIEKEFSKYKKQAKKQPDMDTEIRFVHRSLSLEGNTLTLSETEQLLRKNIPPKTKSFREMQEAVDYKKALDELIEGVEFLDMDSVLKFHSTAMASMKFGAGKAREQNVQIKGNPFFKTADWKELLQKLKEFFEKYQKKIGQKMKAHEAVEFASFLHSQFQWVHPFIDGNSRTSRAIFVHTLLKKGFPMVTFQAGFADQYMGLTKLAKERDDKKFEILMKQIVLHTLKQANKKTRYT